MLLQQRLEHAQDRPELAVVDPDHDRQPGVGAPALGPAAGDVGEVLDVEADQDALLLARQRQQRLVGPPIQLALLVGGADVVAASPRRGSAIRAPET